MCKSRIGPKNRVSILRMELDGAVLAKRLREFILETLNLRFANIYHFIDLSTVLYYLHKEDEKLKLYEGVCVSEIQTAGEFVDGHLKN